MCPAKGRRPAPAVFLCVASLARAPQCIQNLIIPSVGTSNLTPTVICLEAGPWLRPPRSRKITASFWGTLSVLAKLAFRTVWPHSSAWRPPLSQPSVRAVKYAGLMLSSLASWSCYNKSPQTWWLKVKKIDSLAILEARCLNHQSQSRFRPHSLWRH